MIIKEKPILKDPIQSNAANQQQTPVVAQRKRKRRIFHIKMKKDVTKIPFKMF